MANTKWTNDLFDRMRHQGDPLADRAAIVNGKIGTAKKFLKS